MQTFIVTFFFRNLAEMLSLVWNFWSFFLFSYKIASFEIVKHFVIRKVKVEQLADTCILYQTSDN